jgi:hypothetical protein
MTEIMEKALKVWNETADLKLSLDDIVDQYGRGVFETLVRAADGVIAPTSETALLSSVLDRAAEIDDIIERQGITPDVVEEIRWWAMAYSAIAHEDEVDEKTRDLIYEHIYSGDAEGALELARSAAKE